MSPFLSMSPCFLVWKGLKTTCSLKISWIFLPIPNILLFCLYCFPKKNCMFKCPQSRSFRMFLAFRLVTFTVHSHIRWCISYSDAAKFARSLCPNITQTSNFQCIITLRPSVSLTALCPTILFKPSGKIPELDGCSFLSRPVLSKLFGTSSLHHPLSFLYAQYETRYLFHNFDCYNKPLSLQHQAYRYSIDCYQLCGQQTHSGPL